MRSAHSRPVTVGLATGLFVITSGVTGTALATTLVHRHRSTAASATVSASASGTVSSAAIKATSSPTAAGT